VIIPEARDRIRRLESRNPRAALLARVCAFAVLVDPQLMRKLRLDLVPGSRAMDEADLWFSRLVQSRNAEGIVLYPEVAEQLRQDLVQEDAIKAWQITQELHKELPAAIRVEEELALLSRNAEANRGRIEELLREAISEMIVGQKTELANWAGRAISRMPASIQTTEPATVLAIASDLRLGRNGLLEERLSGKSQIPEWLSAALPNLSKIKIGVRLTSDGIEFGPAAEYPAAIEVPDTRPAMVEVRWLEADSLRSALVFIEPGERTAPRPVGNGAVQLLTLANQLYTLEPKPGTTIQTRREGLVARVYSESYAAQIYWSATGLIEGCLGFAIERRTSPTDTPVVLNQFLHFSPKTSAGSSEPIPTTQSPIQRFSWRDVPHARDASSASYRVIPIGGSPDNTQRMDHLASNWTAPVFFRPNENEAISVYFNRSLVNLRSAAQLVPDPSEKSASSPSEEAFEQEGPADESEIREAFGGYLLQKLISLLQQALAMKSPVYAALYDLDDPQLLSILAQFGSNANILLADEKEGPGAREAFARLAKNGVRVVRRTLQRSRLSHNKFLVICDNQQKPVRVWTGNTSWTEGSLCLRSNAAVVIESPEVATFFLEQWRRLVEAKDAFPAALLSSNSTPKMRISAGGARVTVQFTPVRHMEDLEFCQRLIGSAREGILYVASESGRRSSLLEAIQNVKGIYVCGLQRRGPSLTLYKQGKITNVNTNTNLVLKTAPPGIRSSAWLKNVARFGTASVQSRMIVIDPFSDHSIVITGSHGFSLAASAKNDENLVIIENAPEMAIQCATYIAGLYDSHYARAAAKKSATDYPSRLRPDDTWQKRYETPQARQEMYFWMGARRKKLSPEQPLETSNADTGETKVSQDEVKESASPGKLRQTRKLVPRSVRRKSTKKAASKKKAVGKKKSRGSRKSSFSRALTSRFSTRSAAKKSREKTRKKKLK